MGVGLLVAALFIALMQGALSKTWGVTLPRSIMGISGSCITIPCRFDVPDTHEAQLLNCSSGALWRRKSLSGPIVFSGLKPQSSALKGEFVGRLTEKNCTTRFDGVTEDMSDPYLFRLECSDDLKYTFTDQVIITVRAEPPPPQVTPVSPVSEGAQVNLQCSVPVPCPNLVPSLTWIPEDSSRQESTHIRQNEAGQLIKTSTLTFAASADDHEQGITCSVSYPLPAGGSSPPSASTQSLNILYVPRATVVKLSPSGPATDGNAVLFECLSDANPPVSLFTWYRSDNGELTKMGEGDQLVLHVRQKDSGLYLCEAQNQEGSQRSRPVFVQVGAAADFKQSEYVVVIPYVVCGVLFLLFVLTVVVAWSRYQSLSRRLKQLEVKGENTYTNLRTGSVTSDYDHIQLKPRLTPDTTDYENLQKLPHNTVSDIKERVDVKKF